MRNKLPILLALILMAVAAMPWLRSLESQRWSSPTSTTTVPPPEQAAMQAISAGSTQSIESQRYGFAPSRSSRQGHSFAAGSAEIPARNANLVEASTG